MATQHLNLEEQEQIAQIKQFWADYGRLIIALTLIIILAIAGFFSWQWWQAQKATEAGLLYEEMGVAIVNDNQDKVKEIVLQVQTEHKPTYYASLASIVAANYMYAKNDLDDAALFLSWVKDNGKDQGWNAMAVLRLADVLTDQGKYDEALSVLSTKVGNEFLPLIADKRGNVYVAQQDTENAKRSFLEAYQGLGQSDHKAFIAKKLSLLGVDVSSPVESSSSTSISSEG